MKCNAGSTDRLLRALVGLGGIALGFFANIPWGYLGIVLLGTAAMGWCPIYQVLGLSTCKGKK